MNHVKANEIQIGVIDYNLREFRDESQKLVDQKHSLVGGIRNARQGNFFIRDAGESYGDTDKIEKDVRVVTTITFYLTDE